MPARQPHPFWDVKQCGTLVILNAPSLSCQADKLLPVIVNKEIITSYSCSGEILNTSQGDQGSCKSTELIGKLKLQNIFIVHSPFTTSLENVSYYRGYMYVNQGNLRSLLV